uniref:Uncharacterized protein n=1 Tax=Angiostrongylus cantonensis TaxID=6313 RepID=A0A0K0D9S8_ANGCA
MVLVRFRFGPTKPLTVLGTAIGTGFVWKRITTSNPIGNPPAGYLKAPGRIARPAFYDIEGELKILMQQSKPRVNFEILVDTGCGKMNRM